jgi:hypothetical protein
MRRIHLSISLILLLPLLAYAVSSVDFAHRKWLPHPHSTKEESRRLSPGITDARILARQWRGELADTENSPGVLKFRVMTPLGRTQEVRYSIATGDATIRTTTVGLFTTLAYIHVAHAVWAYASITFSTGLLSLGATGIYLWWFKNRGERGIGIVLLLIGVGVPLVLILSMRAGP